MRFGGGGGWVLGLVLAGVFWKSLIVLNVNIIIIDTLLQCSSVNAFVIIIILYYMLCCPTFEVNKITYYY